MDIRANIEQKIKAAGITKKEFCTRCGIQHANNINTMLSAPTWASLERFAAALNMSVAELVADDDAPASALVCPHCGKTITVKLEQ